MARIAWTNLGTTVALELDVSEREGYESTATITEHAVEQGVDISDHVRRNPDIFTLEGWITNTPIVVPATQMAGVTGAVRPTAVAVAGGKTIQASTLQWSSVFDRILTVDTLLGDLIGSPQLVQLTTGLRVEDNLIVTRYKVDRDASTANALALVLEFKRVRIVTTRRVALPAVRRAQTQAQQGAQQGSPVDNRSTAARSADAAIRRLRGGP